MRRGTKRIPAAVVVCALVLGLWPLGLHAQTLTSTGTNFLSFDALFDATATSLRGTPAGGVTTVTDTVTSTFPGSQICYVHPSGSARATHHLFSWASLTPTPTQTFVKIFASSLVPADDTATNTWQTTHPVIESAGKISFQYACFSLFTDGTGKPNTFGRLQYMNAQTWSADLTQPPLPRGSEPTGLVSTTLMSSLSVNDDEGWGVHLESTVERIGPNRFRYEYIFENTTPETVTIAWDSADLTRVLGPFDFAIVEAVSRAPGMESQGYAHVTGLDVSSDRVRDMVAMAVVPDLSLLTPVGDETRHPKLRSD